MCYFTLTLHISQFYILRPTYINHIHDKWPAITVSANKYITTQSEKDIERVAWMRPARCAFNNIAQRSPRFVDDKQYFSI